MDHFDAATRCRTAKLGPGHASGPSAWGDALGPVLFGGHHPSRGGVPAGVTESESLPLISFRPLWPFFEMASGLIAGGSEFKPLA
jgi:hypothetical protein